jgi:hypothetical protein
VLFILKNLDIIYFSWYSLWKLWPLVLVLVGVTILPVKDGIKVALTIVVLVAAAFFLVYYPGTPGWADKWPDNKDAEAWTDNSDSKEIDQDITEAFDPSITEANLIFDAAAGTFKVEQSTEDLFEFTREGNLGRYNYSIQDLGQKREIRIELEDGHIIKTDLKNRVGIKLNPNPVWDIKVDVGAADITMDLSAFKIRSLEIDGGASSIDIKLGTLQADSKIKINSGASSINIKVPKDFACEVNTSTVLTSRDLEGFNKMGDGTYVTPDFSDKTNNIVIDVEAAVSSLNVDRY